MPIDLCHSTLGSRVIKKKKKNHAVDYAVNLLPSEEGTTQNVLKNFTSKPRPETGLDCLVCDASEVPEGGTPGGAQTDHAVDNKLYIQTLIQGESGDQSNAGSDQTLVTRPSTLFCGV